MSTPPSPPRPENARPRLRRPPRTRSSRPRCRPSHLLTPKRPKERPRPRPGGPRRRRRRQHNRRGRGCQGGRPSRREGAPGDTQELGIVTPEGDRRSETPGERGARACGSKRATTSWGKDRGLGGFWERSSGAGGGAGASGSRLAVISLGPENRYLGFDGGEVVIHWGLPYAPLGLDLNEEGCTEDGPPRVRGRRALQGRHREPQAPTRRRSRPRRSCAGSRGRGTRTVTIL